MLTDRQREIAGLVARGLTNKAIARETGLAVQTVKNHISAVAERIPEDFPEAPCRRRIMLFFLTDQQDETPLEAREAA